MTTIAIERLCIKLQSFFGDDFRILPYQDICRDYTVARQVVENGNIGYAMDYTDEFTKLKKEKILGIVNLVNPQKPKSSLTGLSNIGKSYYLSSSITIDFSVPTNIIKRDDNGEILEHPQTNFYQTIETVLLLVDTQDLINFNIDSEDETIGYTGKILLNEPTFMGIEDDGETKFMNYRCTGAFNLTSGAKYGSQYEVYVGDVGNGGSITYYKLDGINSFSEILDANGNAISKQNQAKVEQNLATTSWTCVVGLDDLALRPQQTVFPFSNPDKAKKILYDIIHKNQEVICENASTESAKRKLPVKIITPHGTTRTFTAIVSITFRTDRNGVGSYEVSFTDDNKG